MRHIRIEMFRNTEAADQFHALVCAPAFGVVSDPFPLLFDDLKQRVVLNDQESRVTVFVYNQKESIETIKDIARKLVDAL